MLDALLLLQPLGKPFTVDVIDIDASPDASLLARFDELVPVLYGALDRPELCHYFLDRAAVLAYLEGQTRTPVGRPEIR